MRSRFAGNEETIPGTGQGRVTRRGFLAWGAGWGIGGVVLLAAGCAPPASGTPTTQPAASAAASTSAPARSAGATATVGAPAAASPATTVAPSSTTTAKETSSFTTKVDVDKAKAEKTVSFYTSLDPSILDAISKPFTAQFGISIKYYRAGSASISGKVLAEADAGHVLADIVDASDVGAFLAMKQRGLLQPYESPYATSVAKNLRDPDGLWVADRLTQAILQWNTSLVTGGNVPKHWEDITDTTTWGGKLASADTAGDFAPRLYTLVQHFGWSLLEKIAATKPLIVESVQLMTQVLETGERQVGYAQNDNIAWRSKQKKKPTDYGFPDEGVPTEPGAIGLLKGAAHPNAAMLWFDWWMSDAGQKLLVDGGKYSSRSDFAPPTGSPPLSKLKILTLDYVDFQAHRKEVTDHMAKIFGGIW